MPKSKGVPTLPLSAGRLDSQLLKPFCLCQVSTTQSNIAITSCMGSAGSTQGGRGRPRVPSSAQQDASAASPQHPQRLTVSQLQNAVSSTADTTFSAGHREVDSAACSIHVQVRCLSTSLHASLSPGLAAFAVFFYGFVLSGATSCPSFSDWPNRCCIPASPSDLSSTGHPEHACRPVQHYAGPVQIASLVIEQSISACAFLTA